MINEQVSVPRLFVNCERVTRHPDSRQEFSNRWYNALVEFEEARPEASSENEFVSFSRELQQQTLPYRAAGVGP